MNGLKQFSVRKLIACVLMLAMLATVAACDDGKDPISPTDAVSAFSGIVGTWQEVSIFPRTLVIAEDGAYTLSDNVDDPAAGTVKIEKEEHPDGTFSEWYSFYGADGKLWEGFAKSEEDGAQNDLWSGQDGALHFMRVGADVVTADDYIRVWNNSRCYITVEKQKKNYLVSVRWSSSAMEHTEWTYKCTFDEETASLVCKGGATCVDVKYNESGKAKTKTVYKDGSGSFTISCGTLVWNDEKENAGADMHFIPIDTEE